MGTLYYYNFKPKTTRTKTRKFTYKQILLKIKSVLILPIFNVKGLLSMRKRMLNLC